MNEYLQVYPPMLTVNDVATILGVTCKTVRSLTKSGELGSIKVGRLIRIPKDKFIDYLEKQP